MYGVFVASAGSDAGSEELDSGVAGPDGTAERPYTSIGQALANMASKSRIYVCNGVYTEQVSITTAVSVYGGLSCSAGSAGRVWTYVGQSSQVVAPPSAYALSVTGVPQGSVTIEDMSFAAPDATPPGASSVAAFVSSSSVRLERVALSAGTGADGAPGADGLQHANYTGSAPSGSAQLSSGSSGTLSFVPRSGGVNQCSIWGLSAGGDGGLGCAAGPGSPGMGTPGTATPSSPVTMAGRDGLPRGAPLGDGGADGGTAAEDDPGADGVAGNGGVAAAPLNYGVLSASGWLPSRGGDGDPGNPGQGGAGATDPIYGSCGSSTSIGGGGGGAGGCGGAGGQGGGGGGASIALAGVASNVTLVACSLDTGAAGKGGAGGAGQDGQGGAAGGDTIVSAARAAGAPGGNGAGGSGGAGGTGGISVGVVASGSTIAMDDATTQNTRLGALGAGGAPGPGGKHGSGGTLATGSNGNSGAPGGAGTSITLLQLM
ncbi:MAG: hypothetical protein ACRENE_19545 [Polyangiaceae bacterium]